MRLLVCIANYGDHQLDHLQRVLQAYHQMASSGLAIDIIIDTSVPLNFCEVSDRLTIRQQIHDQEIGSALVFAHRAHVIANRNHYDLFIYSENDILITRENIAAYLSVSRDLPQNYITGFLRYERKKNDEQAYLIDVHPNWPIIQQNTLSINGIDYISLLNYHQGGWILTRNQLNQALNSGGFTTFPHRTKKISQVYDTLESGASDVYTLCGFVSKILPLDRLSRLMVHHLPNKYVNSGGVWDNPGPITLEQLTGLFHPRGKAIRIDRVSPEAILSSAAEALEKGRIGEAHRILKKGIRHCPQSSELFKTRNYLKKKNLANPEERLDRPERLGDRLYLGMAPGENFGWGICSQYLIKELARKRPIQVLNDKDDSSGKMTLPGKMSRHC